MTNPSTSTPDDVQHLLDENGRLWAHIEETVHELRNALVPSVDRNNVPQQGILRGLAVADKLAKLLTTSPTVTGTSLTKQEVADLYRELSTLREEVTQAKRVLQEAGVQGNSLLDLATEAARVHRSDALAIEQAERDQEQVAAAKKEIRAGIQDSKLPWESAARDSYRHVETALRLLDGDLPVEEYEAMVAQGYDWATSLGPDDREKVRREYRPLVHDQSNYTSETTVHGHRHPKEEPSANHFEATEEEPYK